MKPNLLHKSPSELINTNTRRSNYLRSAILAICTVVFLTSSAGALSAQTRLVTTRVEGLPGGLSVSLVASRPSCTNNGMQFVFAGSTELTEDTYITIEPVTIPGGMTTFRSVLHHIYLGEMSVTLPASNGCSQVPTNSFVFEHTVLGEDNGFPMAKRAGVSVFVTTSPFALNRTIEAKTVNIIENGAAPTTVSKGIFHRMAARYDDSFGPADIKSPSLEFTQPGLNFLGIPITISRAKMWISGNSVCLRVGAEQLCRTRSQGGQISIGGVTVDVSDTTESTSNLTRFVTWEFRLEAGFATGNFGLVAAADDADPDAYIVNGEPQALNLLPWKSLKLPVSVIN